MPNKQIVLLPTLESHQSYYLNRSGSTRPTCVTVPTGLLWASRLVSTSVVGPLGKVMNILVALAGALGGWICNCTNTAHMCIMTI